MRVSISALGLATAQGNTTAVCHWDTPKDQAAWPWPSKKWTTSFVCRPSPDLDPKLAGIGRWQSLLKTALAECFATTQPAHDTPVFLASCNGAAAGFDLRDWRTSFDSTALLEGTPWCGARLPVFSSSCNSGMHALFAATQALAAGAHEAVVIAADILSESNQDNFESLRVLAESSITPWQPDATGFLLGEAAVVLKITRGAVVEGQTYLDGPLLTNTLNPVDGLSSLVGPMASMNPGLIIGQGTGPDARDERELATFQPGISPDIPITSPLLHFGHTLGASGLLSVALAALCIQKQRLLDALAMPVDHASDGRPLANASAQKSADSILITSEAMDGSCAAVGVTNRSQVTEETAPSNPRWRKPCAQGALMHPVLRRLAADALSHRPPEPPAVLLVRLDEPLAPVAQAWFGERLLPSAVLEITPGFVSQLTARAWGFAGPALCLVGRTTADEKSTLRSIFEQRATTVAEVGIVGTGDHREIIWNN